MGNQPFVRKTASLTAVMMCLGVLKKKKPHLKLNVHIYFEVKHWDDFPHITKP